MNNKTQKKIAVINDISGYGRCSMTVALPVISAMGIQCCPVPTSILSNHTGYPEFYFDDYTDRMSDYLAPWKSLQFTFDGILTGFLGSPQQLEIVEQFIHDFKSPSTQVIIDPVMGDHGKVYQTCTPKLCARMRQLAAHADVLTPNLTEACILADIPYQEHFTRSELISLARSLHNLCGGCVVITGVHAGSYLCNVLYNSQTGITFLRKKQITLERCGTGDVFSSIVASGTVLGIPLSSSVRLASDFISDCLKETAETELEKNEGVAFEPLLGSLISRTGKLRKHQ